MGISLFSPLALFYPPPHSSGGQVSYSFEQARAVNTSRLLLLKKFLSQTLTRFYHFAGRIKSNNSIECNDDEVPFYEAFAYNYQFENVLRNLDITKHFLPSTAAEDGSVFHYTTLHPLLIQVTLFKCGGMDICMCDFQKVVNRAKLYTLTNA